MANNLDNLRILMFAIGFAPYEASENLCNSKLVLAFLENGWRVDVISRTDTGFMYSIGWHEPWLQLRQITHEIGYKAGSRVVRMLDGLRQTLRLRHPVEGLRWAGRALELSRQLHKERKYNVILSRSPAEVGHLPAMVFARETCLPWVANWNDPPCYLRPHPYEYHAGFVKRYLHMRLVRQVMCEATVNTFPCERLKKHVIRAVRPSADDNTAVIPHVGGGIMEFGSPTRDGQFKLCHAGHLSKEQDVKALFEGLAVFASRHSIKDSLTLEIIGVENLGIRTLAKDYGLLSNIRMTGPLPYRHALRRMAENDVLIVLEAPYREGILLLSKVVDYAQVGRPILAVSPVNGTMADLISEHGGGIVADCRYPNRIAVALTALYNAWRRNTLEEKYGSRHLYKIFSPKIVIKAYEKLFWQLGIVM